MVYAKKSKTLKTSLETDETSSPSSQSQRQCMSSEGTTRGTHYSSTTATSSKNQLRVPRDVTTSCDRVLRNRRSTNSGINHHLHGFVGRPQKRLFTPEIKRQLKEWLVKRRRYPYPTREEKHRLAQDTGLDYNQICNWFANWRRKLKNAECEGSGTDAGDKSDIDFENTEEERSHGPIGSLSWGRRILLYNHVAARNAEKIPIASDDSLLEDENDDFDDEFSSDSSESEANYIPCDFPSNSDFKSSLNTTAMDHCYSLLPQLNPTMDTNGNYKNSPSLENVQSNNSPDLQQAKKWLESVERYKPQKQIKNSQHATTWASASAHSDTLKPETCVKVKLTKRTILTVKEKYEICQFKDGHPNYSHQNVADHFTSRWGKKISRRVIGDIIADRHKWTEECEESTTRNVKRFKGGKHEELEDLLELWVSEINATDGNLTDLAITEQAKVFGKKLGILDFQYSSGWLHRFKRRRGLLARPAAARTKSQNSIVVTSNAKFGDNNFFDVGNNMNNLTTQLYTNFDINCNTGTVKLPIDEMISAHMKKEINVGTFDDFFQKQTSSNVIIVTQTAHDLTAGIVDVVADPSVLDDKIEDISVIEATYAVEKLKSFFVRKANKCEIVEKIIDIENEIKNYL